MVLPAPFGPKKPNISPGLISKLRLFTTFVFTTYSLLTFLILIILIILTTYLSFKNSMKQTGNNSEMERQMQFSLKFMIIMISFASLSLPTAIALYWIVTNLFAVIQNYIIKNIIEKRI